MKNRFRGWLWHLGLMLLLAEPLAAAVRLDIQGADAALEENIRAHVGTLPEDPAAAGAGYQRRVRAAAEEAAQALG